MSRFMTTGYLAIHRFRKVSKSGQHTWQLFSMHKVKIAAEQGTSCWKDQSQSTLGSDFAHKADAPDDYIKLQLIQ